jgi:putative lipoic acid-binding regulatory protein
MYEEYCGISWNQGGRGMSSGGCVVTERMNKVCAVLTAAAKRVKKDADPGTFIVGMDSDGKFHLTAVVIGVRASNRHQMGILVNALREQDTKTSYSAVGMCLNVELSDNDFGKKQEALYVCLEDRFGNAEDVIFFWRKKRFGGFELERPTSKEVEPRVFGAKGDELVALVKERITEVVRAK